jgi:hypothetical protein
MPKVTPLIVKLPKGQEPDSVISKIYQLSRFVLGKNSANQLVAICMNPSAAR